MVGGEGGMDGWMDGSLCCAVLLSAAVLLAAMLLCFCAVVLWT